MPSSKVQSILRNFKAHFQTEEGVHIPMSLRQESTDVVFISLLEEDKPPFEMPTQMAGFEPDAPMMPVGQEDPMAMLDELLGASGQATGADPMAMPSGGLPVAPGEPGGAPAAPLGAAPTDLASMLGMM